MKSLLYSPPKPAFLFGHQDSSKSIIGKSPTKQFSETTLIKGGQMLLNMIEKKDTKRYSNKRMKSSQLIREGKLEEALQEVNLMLDSHYANPQSSSNEECKKAQAYYLRGQIHERKGDLTVAITDYKQALASDPALINAAFAKAACENKIGNYEEAINTYNEAFAMERDSQNTTQHNHSASYYLCTSNLKGQISGGQISTNRSIDGIAKINDYFQNATKSNVSSGVGDPYVFSSRIETLSPQSNA